jgi:hypothetical protein
MCTLKREERADGVYYIANTEKGDFIFESKYLALTPRSQNPTKSENYKELIDESQELIELQTVSNEDLDKIIANDFQVAVKGFIVDSIWKPTFIANRIVILWSRL